MTSGVRAKGKIAVYIDDKKTAGNFGELQFVDSGISGIPAFQVSRYVSIALYENRSVNIRLDMFSHLGDIENLLNSRKNILSFVTMGDLGNGLINS